MKVQLIYNVVSISAVQQSDSVIHIYMFFSHITIQHILSQVTGQSAAQQDHPALSNPAPAGLDPLPYVPLTYVPSLDCKLLEDKSVRVSCHCCLLSAENILQEATDKHLMNDGWAL